MLVCSPSFEIGVQKKGSIVHAPGTCISNWLIYRSASKYLAVKCHSFRESSSDMLFRAVVFIPFNNSAISWGIYGAQVSRIEGLDKK